MSLEYTVCEHCAVNNVPDRSVCWNCGTALPVAYGPDGRHAAVHGNKVATISKDEIDALLARANIVDAVAETKQFHAAQAAAAGSARESNGQGASVGGWLGRMLRRHQTQP
jgi:hypothetical protein